MTTLIAIISALLIGLASALVTKFVLYIIGDPWKEEVNTKALFSRIGVWIAQGYDHAEKMTAIRMQRIRENKHIDRHAEDRYLSTMKNWWMAAGACYYCLNVYVSVIVSCLIFTQFDLSLWLLIASLPASHYAIGWVME